MDSKYNVDNNKLNKNLECTYRRYDDNKWDRHNIGSYWLRSFRLTPVKESDMVMSEQEFYEKLDHSINQVKEGKVIYQKEGESTDDFIDRMLCIN